MNWRILVRRFLVPQLVVSFICMIRFRAFVSTRAEVEYSANLKIGRGTKIGSFTKIKTAHGELNIGRNVAIATGCFITSDAAGIEIGDDTMLGPNVTILANNYQYDRLDLPICEQGTVSKGVRIGRGTWIGAGVVVVDGARIEDGAIVAPNSVVSGSIAANTIAHGNPSKAIFTRR